MPSPSNNEKEGSTNDTPPASNHDDKELTTAERSRVRQQMLQWERDRRLEETNEKQRRIIRGKEEAKEKRLISVAKKTLEEEAAMTLAGGLSPSAKPFEPTPGASGPTNGDKRRSRDESEEEGDEQGDSKKQGVGSPMRTSKVQTPASPLKINEIDMGIGIEGEDDDSRMKGPPSILKKSGGSLANGGESVGTANTAKSRSRPKAKTPAGAAPKGNKKTMSWGKNKTKTFANDEEDSEDSVESVTPAAGRNAGRKDNKSNGDSKEDHHPTPAETWKSTSVKKAKRSLAGATKLSAPKVIPYTQTAFVMITAYIEPNVPGREVAERWITAIIQSLAKLHTEDKAVCLLQPDNITKGKAIYFRSDTPNTFRRWDDYVFFDNKDLMSMKTPDGRARRIVGHALMGFSEEPKQFLLDMRTDIANTDYGGDTEIQYAVKKFQVWKSSRRLVLVNGPCYTTMENYKSLVWEQMDALEKRLVIKHPDRFPPAIHSNGPFPQWDCELDWGKGGNWKDSSKNKTRENTNHRKVPTFVYNLQDEDRILAVARACKDRKLEQTHFGQSARLQELPATKPSDTDQKVKDNLDRLWINHGGAQKSLGNLVLEGIVDPHFKVKVDLEDDNDGPRSSPGDFSVIDILSKIFIGRPKLFQAILRGENGKYYAFFSNINELSMDMATEIGQDAGAWLKIYLLKQGWKFACIQRLIVKSFSPEAADMAGKAKYCKRTKRVISGYALQQRADDKAIDEMGIIDRMKGYTDSELEELKREDDLLSGAERLNMPAISAGSFAAFNFGDDMSVQTIHPGGKRPGATSVNGDSTYKMGAESQASLLTNDSYGFGDFQEDEREDEGMGEVEILMPDGGLKEMDTDEASAHGNGSAASDMSPRVLDAKFDDRKAPPEDLAAWADYQRHRSSAFAASRYQARMDEEREDSEWEQEKEEILKRKSEREARKAALEESERNARTAAPAAADIQAPMEDSIIKDTLEQALNAAGGSREDKERKIREMLARLMQESSAIALADEADPNTSSADAKNTNNLPIRTDDDSETKANQASNTMETSIPANNASKPPDPEVRAESLSHGEREGVEVGHIKGDDLSQPG